MKGDKVFHFMTESLVCVYGRRQAIIWTNAGILLIGPLVTNFDEVLIEIYTFLFTKIVVCEMVSILSRPHCVKCPIWTVKLVVCIATDYCISIF